MLLIGGHNALDQLVPHHIAMVEGDEADVGDLPEDWVEGINYAVLTVTTTSSSISGTITPDEDGSPTTHIYGIQIAKLPGTTLIPGDATGDNKVDDADAKKLAEFWGHTSATRAMGDFNGDQKVDAKDAAILAANWGFGVGDATSAAVPEPSALALLLALSLTVFPSCRRRR